MEQIKEAYLLSLYFKALDLTNKSELCALIKKHLDKSAQEAILPIPPDAPSEIPRIILNAANPYKVHIEIMANRINIRPDINNSDLEGTISLVVKILEEVQILPSRLALVHSFRFKADEKNPVKYISSNLLSSTSTFDEIEDVQLNYLQTVDIENTKYNMWTRHAQERISDSETYYFLEFDINSKANNESEFSIEDIKKHLLEADSLILNKKSEYESM